MLYVSSGDVGCWKTDPLTGQASFFIVDRKKEIIKVRGWSVSPTEIEAVLSESPAIVDAAVVGSTGFSGEESIKAYVTVKPQSGQSKLDASELRLWLLERLASYKIPQDIIVIPEIPRSPTGKILRRFLREEQKDVYAVTSVLEVI